MSTLREREELRKLYPNSTSWQEKVTKMSDAQVIAIYNNKKSKGKLAK